MMKKIFILIIAVFSCSACFNYVEINDLVIVSGIGIDYKDGNYNVLVEALYQNKENSESNFEWGQIKEGQGKTLSDAFYDLTLSLERDPYYAHLKVLVISEEVANNHIEDLFDFFLRNNDIRNIFSIVVSDKVSPKELLSQSNEYYPVISERIKEILENNIYSNYISQNLNFKEIVSNYIGKEKNIALTMIGLDDKDPIISKLLIFDDKKPVGYLNEDYAKSLSILTNNTPNILINYECENKNYITIKIYKSDVNYKIYKDKYYVNLNLDGEIIENNCNIDLDNMDEYNDITKKISNYTKSNIENYFYYTKSLGSDILGINKKYYDKYRKKEKDYFKNTDNKTNVNLNLNKKGLIFEVKKND